MNAEHACRFHTWSWVDRRGKVTHNIRGWPKQWGFYCYKCDVFYTKKWVPSAPPAMARDAGGKVEP